VERLLIDTATVYYRAYYALPESLTAPDGFPHNALRGTLSTFAGLIRRFQSTDIIAAWDADWRPDWRVALVPSYKTHRLAVDGATEDEPDTLGPQIGAIAEVLTAVGLAPMGVDNFEADDVIGTLARRSTGHTVIVTNDRDLVQCVRDDAPVQILLMAPGGMHTWQLSSQSDILERFGVPADRYVDFAVLRGDPSDGLPGVPGVGQKTAQALLREYHSLAGVIKASQDIPLQRPLTPRIAARIAPADLESAYTVTRVVEDLDIAPPSPWIPSKVQTSVLLELSAGWGVERQVDELLSALQGAHDAASE
jgi:5'-3' exonuclease